MSITILTSVVNIAVYQKINLITQTKDRQLNIDDNLVFRCLKISNIDYNINQNRKCHFENSFSIILSYATVKF